MMHSPFCGCDECSPPVAAGGRSGLPSVAKAPGDHGVEQILDAVAEVYKLTMAELKGRDRHRSVAEARNLAVWFAYKLTPLSYPQIGRALGRDHTTIMANAKKIERRLLTDQVLRDAAERVLGLLDQGQRRSA